MKEVAIYLTSNKMLLNTRDLQLMNAFESITRAQVVDVFESEGSLNYLVKKGDLGKALGKNGANISKARKSLGKRIVVFEDSNNPREFIEKACSPIKCSPSIEEDKIQIDVPRSQREDISGKQIRIIKELVIRKLNVSKVDFVFV